MAAPFDWEAEGTRLGETLDHLHAVLVVGSDREATAQVAVGIGKAQAPRRRVAVGDLLGEAPPIQSLVEGDDPHGIVDSFVYGVSLNRIAREVPGIPELYVMPTGTEPIEPSAMFANTRWRRLASGFREMGALLVLAAPAEAPAIDALAAQLDGVILVGNDAPRSLPVAAVLAVVREQPRAARPVAQVDSPASFESIAMPERRWTPVRVFQAAAAFVVLAGIGIWFAARPFAADVRPYAPKPDTTQPVSAVIPGATDSGTAGAARVIPVVANAADSANASPFAVELLATNTQAGAAARVREESGRTPATTFSPAIVDGAEWYKVIVGAYAAREPADSLLAALRRRGQLDERSGSVVRLPYAFLVHSAVAPDKLQGLLNAYRDLGQPVYALQQADGTMNLYSGAYASPEQAALFVESVRAAGVTPTLVFRTGRVL